MRIIAVCSLLAFLWALPMGKSPLATSCCIIASLGSCGILVFAGRHARGILSTCIGASDWCGDTAGSGTARCQGMSGLHCRHLSWSVR